MMTPLNSFVILFVLIHGLHNFPVCVSSDVFASMDHLQELANVEPKMTKALKDYIDADEERLDNLEMLLDIIASVHSRPEANNSYDFVGHPLNAFHLIKRYIIKWPDVFYSIDFYNHKQELKDIADHLKQNGLLPQSLDYEGALLALLRLQKVYNIQSEQISEGWVLHKKAAPLGHEHMYDIGVAALNKLHEYDLAEKWLRTARNVERPPIANLDDVDEVFRNTRDANKERKNHQQVNQEPAAVKRYHELCQESTYKDFLSSHSQYLDCFMSSTTVPYYSFKVELINLSPEIAMIYDFINEHEANAAMTLAGKRMNRAKVGLNEASSTSNARVGKVAFFNDEHHPLINSISNKASLLSGLNMTYPTAEPLQVINYGLGGQYDVHYDFDIRRYEHSSQELSLLGDRIATLMIYLDNVTAGGATVFPLLGVYVKPVAKAALFWYNYDITGNGDASTLHAACPVLLGQKWIANKWIRQYGQELVRPCDPFDKPYTQ